MGRKSSSKQNNNKKQPSPPKETKYSILKRKELLIYVDKLLKLTSILQPTLSPSKSMEHFLEVSEVLNKIKEIESTIHNIYYNQKRHLNIEKFKKWLLENGALFEGIEISAFEGYDFGLKATKDFKEGELILSIPRKIMMTEKEARESDLKEFIHIDLLLQNMPNITLALFLLLERCNPDSFWKPYIDVLPNKYSTILYFTPEDMAELKPSPVLDQALRLFRSIARQYAYFYNKIFTQDVPVLKRLRETYSYENYRWAVSTVMTRQNNIHIDNADHTSFIPLWDMCNHEHGKITTDFNTEKQQGECFAVRNFKGGEQIFIYYGTRPNSELFLHNGFVYPNNKQDSLSIALGVSSSDPLRETKLDLLKKLGLASITHYNIYNTENPIVPELLAFIRIFNMNKEELSEWTSGEFPSQLVSPETADWSEVCSEVDKKAYSYLLTRCQLLLSTYKKNAKEQVYGDVSVLRNNIKLLKECEVRILEHVIKSLNDKIASLPAGENVKAQ